MNIIILVLLSLLGGLFYRLGGIGSDRPKWLKNAPWWVCDTKARDVGVPLVIVAYMAVSGYYTHWLWLCFGLLWGAQTTYNKWAHRLILKEETDDVMWIDWMVTGLAYSLALLPYAVYTGGFIGLLVRGLVVTLFTWAWSEFIGKDWLEEAGRGFIQVVTLPLLFI